MDYTYDLLPPVIPDSIPPSTKGEFTIPITVYGEIQDKTKTLSDFSIGTIQIAITNQDNTNLKLITKGGKDAKRDNNNENIFLLTLNSTDLPKDSGKDEDQFYKIQMRYSRQKKDLQPNKKNYSEWSSVCLLKKIKSINLDIRIGNYLLPKNNKQGNLIIPNIFFSIDGEMSSKSNEILKNYQVILQRKNDNTDSYSEYLKTDFLPPDSKNTFSYKINKGFTPGTKYRLCVNANTTSGYSFETQYYQFTIANGIVDEEKFLCQAEANEQQGSIDVYIVGEKKLRKNFIIQRASSQDNFTSWEKMTIVQFKGDEQQSIDVYDNKNLLNANQQYNNYTKLIWSDKTIKSGIFYKYSVAILYKLKNSSNKNIFLAGSYSNPTNAKTCIFEDMYLMGKGKSLRIKYNPEINNFKYNVTQTVQSTLGSKYPFITRTGKNNYRSFQIGGLITTFMDTDSRNTVPSAEDSNSFKMNKQQTYTEKFFIDNDNYNKLKTLFSDFVIGPSDDLVAEGETITDIENFSLSAKIQLLQQNGSVVDFQAREGTIVLYKNKNNYYSKYIFQEEKWKKIINNSYELKSFVSSEELFSKTTLNYRRTYNTQQNINQYNDIVYEREFREAVSKFLYDPTPKLFRSSQEGNILVRLTNINFSPIKELGRQLYSFTADAIEIDEYNMDNLYKYKIYQTKQWKPLYKTYEIIAQQANIAITDDKNYSLDKPKGFLYYSSISITKKGFQNIDKITINITTEDNQSKKYTVGSNGLTLNNIRVTNFTIDRLKNKNQAAELQIKYTYIQEQQAACELEIKKDSGNLLLTYKDILYLNQDLFDYLSVFNISSSSILSIKFAEQYRTKKNNLYLLSLLNYCFLKDNTSYVIKSARVNSIEFNFYNDLFQSFVFKGLCCKKSVYDENKFNNNTYTLRYYLEDILGQPSTTINISEKEEEIEYYLFQPNDLNIQDIQILYEKTNKTNLLLTFI